MRERCVALLIVLSAAMPVAAQVPQLIRYQGTLVDANNVPLEGNYLLTFRLYATETGGSPTWTETQSTVPVSRGVFNILLGQATPLTLPFDKDYWLTTQVGTDAEMAPRQRLTSVPYAYRAAVAERLDAKPWFEVDTAGMLTTGLVAYWKLEESGGTRTDVVGSNALTDHNTVIQAAGKKGQAAQFVRANAEYLSIADNTDLSTGNASFTIAAWVYLDSVATNTTIYARFGESQNEFYLRKPADDRFRLTLSNPTGSNSATVENTVPTTGAWYLVIAWHDAVNQQIGISVNNNSPVMGPDIAIIDGTNPTTIGALPGGGEPFDGRIDEVGFWKRVLTAQERADLYNGGAGNSYQPVPSPAPTSVRSRAVGFIRTAAQGSGYHAITGIGFQPTAIWLSCRGDVAGETPMGSFGLADQELHGVNIHQYKNGNISRDPGTIVSLTDGTNSMHAYVRSLDPDGFTIEWVKNNNGPDAYCVAMALR